MANAIYFLELLFLEMSLKRREYPWVSFKLHVVWSVPNQKIYGEWLFPSTKYVKSEVGSKQFYLLKYIVINSHRIVLLLLYV